MRLVFKGFKRTTSYASAHVERVYAGDEFEVPDAIGQKMLSDFGGAFQVIRPAVKTAPKTVVISSGDAVDTSVLDGSVSSIRDALETGDHDADLYLLREAELQGKTRKGAISVIEARLEEVSP